MTAKRHETYLDYNATAPLLPVARQAVIDALDEDGNPSSTHKRGRAAKAIVQKARRQVAALVNAKPDHVVFTSGATEAAMLALSPAFSMGRAPFCVTGLYVAASDHPCILAGGRFDPATLHVMPVDANGVMDLDALDAALACHDRSAGTALVATHWANNETGVIQPVDCIGAIARRHGAMLVLDAVQAAGRVTIDLDALDADYLLLSAHKLGAPKGAGALVAKSDLVMPMPLMTGGGQERGHRSGTEPVSTIAGFGAACAHAALQIDQFAALTHLRDRLIVDLKRQAPALIIHGENASRLANTVYFSIPGKKAETLQIALDLKGFAVSSGSACSSGKVGKSHVLEAMGVSGDEGAIRVSFAADVSPDALHEFSQALGAIAQR